MPDPETPPGAPAPAAPAVVPPAAPATPPAVAKVEMTSEQLKERLAESGGAATKALLKELGFKSPDDAKAALKKLADIEAANLSEAERRQAEIDALKPRAERADRAAALLLELANEQLKGLPEEARKLIDDEVGDDPEGRILMVKLAKAMAPAGATPAATTVATPQIAPPATAAPSPAPTPSGATTKFQEWEAMNSRSPALGDIFYSTHKREIERTRPASA
jgi:hypothetical protein